MIDIFFEKLPHSKTHHSAEDCFYAIAEVKYSGGSYFHVLLTDDQYKYRVKNRLTCTTWREMVAARPDRAKTIKDEKNGDKLVPLHVFGDCVYDPIVDEDILPTRTVAATRAEKATASLELVAESLVLSEDLAVEK